MNCAPRAFPPETKHVSLNAHLIMPYHRRLDAARNPEGKGEDQSSTGRGIGPAYGNNWPGQEYGSGGLLDENTFAKCRGKTWKRIFSWRNTSGKPL